MEEIFALPDLRHWLPSERLVAGSDSGNFVFDQRTITKALRDIGPLSFLTDGEPSQPYGEETIEGVAERLLSRAP